MFQSHPSTSTVTLADGSTSCVIGSRIIHPTSLITLTYVLSLPQFYFNTRSRVEKNEGKEVVGISLVVFYLLLAPLFMSNTL